MDKAEFSLMLLEGYRIGGVRVLAGSRVGCYIMKVVRCRSPNLPPRVGTIDRIVFLNNSNDLTKDPVPRTI